MSITATPPIETGAHEKTIDVHLDRIREYAAQAAALTTASRRAPLDTVYARRLLADINQARAFVAAHTQSTIDRIIATIPDVPDQDTAIAAAILPLRHSSHIAGIATARLHRLLAE